ncbi:hypothetical protein TNCV_2491951 [Trichonephila clavipes]|nr:hypothetical protein TNCV_2491951 [Trichonephila clavipes]
MLPRSGKPVERKIEELTEININKAHIACLQETKLNPNLKLKIKGFTTQQKDRKDRPGGGLAFLVKSADIKFRERTLPPTTDYDENSTEVQATPKKQTFLLTSYHPLEEMQPQIRKPASLLAKHYENKSKLTFNANDRKLLQTYRKTIQDSKRYNHKNIFTIPFSMEELEAAIAKMNPGIAPGPDVIFGRMVQHFGNLAKKELLENFKPFFGYWQTAQNLETFHRHYNSKTKQECFRVQKL